MSLVFFDCFIVRIKSMLSGLGLVAVAIIAHSDKLHFGEKWNDAIILACFILMSISKPTVSKIQERADRD